MQRRRLSDTRDSSALTTLTVQPLVGDSAAASVSYSPDRTYLYLFLNKSISIKLDKFYINIDIFKFLILQYYTKIY